MSSLVTQIGRLPRKTVKLIRWRLSLRRNLWWALAEDAGPSKHFNPSIGLALSQRGIGGKPAFR
jgi:hypothetical protein